MMLTVKVLDNNRPVPFKHQKVNADPTTKSRTGSVLSAYSKALLRFPVSRERPSLPSLPAECYLGKQEPNGVNFHHKVFVTGEGGGG